MELNVYSTFNKINLWCYFSDLTGILVGINLASYEQLSVHTCVCVCVYVFLYVCFKVALVLQLGEGGIRSKLSNQKKQVK